MIFYPCFQKVKKLHMYDCLRANKSMMGWGVEARVPFLDRVFLDYAMNLDPEVKMCPGKAIYLNSIRITFLTANRAQQSLKQPIVLCLHSNLS